MKLAALILLLAIQQPSFEVASIKGNNIGVKVPPALTMNPGGINFTNVTAWDCITSAYGVKDYQVASNAEWVKTSRYDISAKTSAASPDDQLKLMLQRLLADRFKLTLHHESREIPLYAITEGKGGSRLKPSAGGPENSLRFEGNRLAFRNYTIAALVKFLSSLPSVDRPISDATNLKGGFDFDLTMDAPSADPGAVKRAMLDWASMFADIDQQLGLKVEARKAAMDVLVIDRIEKPTEN